ncbi:hypothetical protein IL252_04155 [Halomicrobium sp. IBSBa]|uniref:hypothetical protein n=1 Tax=Halomicrobium sp. IBSBa TaxID=2778916 RepID=UPI001ABFCEC0|nr:hypothetical protein [Halomicrobium sp. IBSBa]MBO4247015.1 hypothetical protein [Halomicrobium sp. IBSBa]
MSRITKALSLLGTLVAVVTVFTPALYAVSHTQALANVLLGQFAAMTIGYTAYRIASGKRPTLRPALIGLLCGLGIAISPVVLVPVTGFTTVTMFGGGFVAAIGLYGVVASQFGEDEDRIPDLSAERSPDESLKAA